MIQGICIDREFLLSLQIKYNTVFLTKTDMDRQFYCQMGVRKTLTENHNIETHKRRTWPWEICSEKKIKKDTTKTKALSFRLICLNCNENSGIMEISGLIGTICDSNLSIFFSKCRYRVLPCNNFLGLLTYFRKPEKFNIDFEHHYCICLCVDHLDIYDYIGHYSKRIS
jgi:hypothetical protein